MHVYTIYCIELKINNWLSCPQPASDGWKYIIPCKSISHVLQFTSALFTVEITKYMRKGEIAKYWYSYRCHRALLLTFSFVLSVHPSWSAMNIAVNVLESMVWLFHRPLSLSHETHIVSAVYMWHGQDLTLSWRWFGCLFVGLHLSVLLLREITRG